MTTSSEQKSNPVQYLEVDDEQAGQRVDNFLVKVLKGAPKTLIYRILRKGEVRVNKGRVKPDYRLQAGDRVRVPPIRLTEPSDKGSPGQRTLDWVNEAIIYEDDVLLILNKPSGLAVHGGSGVSYGAIEALRALRPEAKTLELVHRLDRDTSGVLLVAKRSSALRHLHEQIRNDRMEKYYLALLMGRWKGGERRIEAPLKKNTLKSGERMVEVHPEGKPSLSLFRPETQFQDATLVSVKLITGRTHQVRVHAAHIGMPIAGDDKYGDADFNALMRTRGLKRLFLHAQRIGFEHPKSGEWFVISAPLPEELQQPLMRLEKAISA